MEGLQKFLPRCPKETICPMQSKKNSTQYEITSLLCSKVLPVASEALGNHPITSLPSPLPSLRALPLATLVVKVQQAGRSNSCIRAFAHAHSLPGMTFSLEPLHNPGFLWSLRTQLRCHLL